jgi:hypothetical protein
MDAALDSGDMTHGRALLENTRSAAADLRQERLLRRARLGAGGADPTGPPPSDQSPEGGHGSARAGMAVGATTGGELFQSLEARLALHDLMDPEPGYPRLAGLEFLPIRLRWRMELRRLELEDFAIARVTSLTPLDPFDSHWSWKASFGAMTRTDDCDACLAGRVLLGAGGTVALGRRLTLFVTGDLEALYAWNAGWKLPLRVGAGPAAGLLLRLGPVTALATGDTLFYPRQPPARLWHAGLAVRVALGRNYSLFAEGNARRGETSARLGGLLYF